MKKSIKLPLFLGSVALICSAALAIVNEITEPVVEQNEIKAANEGYLALFGLDSFEGYKIATPEPTSELSAKGVKKVFELHESNDSLFGVAYDFNVRGYGGELIFQIAFKDSKYLGLNVVSSSETPSFGGEYLEALGTYLKGKDASLDRAKIETDTVAIKAGTTVTRTPVLDGIEVAAAHYVAGIK